MYKINAGKGRSVLLSGILTCLVGVGCSVGSFSAKHAGGVNSSGVLSSADVVSSSGLTNLSLSIGQLSPAFNSATTSYTATINGSTMGRLSVVPTIGSAAQGVTVNGASIASGSASPALTMKVGANTIPIVVTARDGSQTTYIVSVILANGGVIRTFAGNGTLGHSGDGGAATAAASGFPFGVAVDSVGNVYIADTNNSLIRKVDVSGKISTFAGNGTFGYSGDGGAATAAALKDPFGVAVDSAGNVYIADYTDNRIRKVDVSGKISTFAGTGTSGYSGDGGAATAAKLHTPNSVAVDLMGNVYIGDGFNSCVRKVDVSGKISTLAGNRTWGYSGDGGPATAAALSNLYGGVAVDSVGNVYIADTGNRRIRKVDVSGKISTLAGNGTRGYSGDGGVATSGILDNPIGVAVDSVGNVYIADTGNESIRKVDVLGNISTLAGNGISGYSGDEGAATAAKLYAPYSVAVDSAGNIYIADQGNNRIRIIQ